MQLASINSTTAASGSSTSPALEETLGKDAFLKLLITQIRYQDPLSPLDNSEFIAQLAQFSSLEQMQQMNTGLWTAQLMAAGTQALSLVGRHVIAQEPGADPIEGTVDAVSFRDGTPILLVGGQEVQLAWVSEAR
jgi:flagellar basal-body rod modification protein FlgD